MSHRHPESPAEGVGSDRTPTHSPDQLQDAVHVLARAQADLTATLGELRQQLSESLERWDGPARAAYDRVQDDWDASATHLAEIIERMRVVLDEVAATYDAGERRATQRWQ